MNLDIFQRHLDAVTATLMTDDFEAYMGLVDIPLVVLTEKATTIIETREEFQFGFESYAGMLKSQGATQLIRLANNVAAYGAHLLTGRYETHILRGGNRIYGPFHSAASLRFVDDVWKVCAVVTPVHDDAFPINAVQEPRALSAS